jgi:zinc D-Ala-D-Ala dipeptidase
MAIYFSFLILFLPSICFSQTKMESPIPGDSKQMVIVLTDSVKSTKGVLVYFERQNDKNSWEKISDIIPTVVGRNGLGWGKGLNSID